MNLEYARKLEQHILFFAAPFTVLTGYPTFVMCCLLFSFSLRFIGPQRKTWTKTARDQVPIGVGVHIGVEGVALWMWEKYDTWPDVGKNYANTGEHFRFQWNYVFAAYLLLFTCFAFGFFFSSLSSYSSSFSLVRFYSHTISLRHISFDYGFDGSACELQAKLKGNEMKWIWKWKWNKGEKREKQPQGDFEPQLNWTEIVCLKTRHF